MKDQEKHGGERPVESWQLPPEKIGLTDDFHAPLTPAIRRQVKDILKSEDGGISVEGEDEKHHNITRFDLFLLPPGTDASALLEKALGLIDFTNRDLERLSRCFREAKDYLRNYLHVGLPKELDRLTDLKSREEVVNFFSHAAASRKKANIGFGPYYCALAKVTFAFWEFERGEMQNLVHQTEYLYESLTNPVDSVVEFADGGEKQHFFKYTSFGAGYGKEKEGKDGMVINLDGTELLTLANYRGKTPERTITKMLSKPEFDLQQAITDGIGMRFEVDSRMDAIELIAFLKNYLFYGSEHVELRDHQFAQKLLPQEQERAKQILEDAALHFNIETNPATADEYESINIRGDLNLPRKPENPQSMLMSRAVEIQIILKGNKNEEGFNGHEIYEARQKLQAISRLFGSFSEDYLDLICKDASEKTDGKLQAEDIKNSIIERKYITPIKESSIQAGRHKYCWTSYFSRWSQTGFLPPTITDRSEEDNGN